MTNTNNTINAEEAISEPSEPSTDVAASEEPAASAKNLSPEATGATSGAEKANAKVVKKDHATPGNPLTLSSERLPFSLLRQFQLVTSQTGRLYAVIMDKPNPYCLTIGSKALDQLFRQIALAQGVVLRKHDLTEINEVFGAYGEMSGEHRDVWYRVAKIDNGIEIDLGDDQHSRVRITPGRVEIVQTGSDTLFFRVNSTRPFIKPAAEGDHGLLDKYLNIDAVSKTLFLAWLTYTLAHPKSPGTGYVILVVKGEQGAGKSFLTRLIQSLTDPSNIGIRMLPRNGKDLAITLSNTHVAAFDNVRGFSTDIADLFCMSATGGALPSRKLYTDDTEHVQYLHGAVVVNGIHSFITQPDLAQRCLTITLRPLPSEARRSEADLIKEFEADLPCILRGVFELIAQVFLKLPAVEITDSERMLDFVKWLGAMEQIDGTPAGVYQGAYSQVLHEAELDTLLDHPLAAAVIDFAKAIDGKEWSGTPTEFYDRLCLLVPDSTQRSRYWPANAIAMSKRLVPLIAGLRDQCIQVVIARGQRRKITITVMEGFDNE